MNTEKPKQYQRDYCNSGKVRKEILIFVQYKNK